MLRLSRSTVVICFVWICLFSARTIAAADVITARVKPVGQLRLIAPESSCHAGFTRAFQDLAGGPSRRID